LNITDRSLEKGATKIAFISIDEYFGKKLKDWCAPSHVAAGGSFSPRKRVDRAGETRMKLSGSAATLDAHGPDNSDRFEAGWDSVPASSIPAPVEFFAVDYSVVAVAGLSGVDF
jgi:hypothetical protein